MERLRHRSEPARAAVARPGQRLEVGRDRPAAVKPDGELPQSIDDIMASIRESLAEGAATPAAVPPTRAVPPASPVAPAADTTLDALVRSMLAPMLQAWLDAHLPEIVERATDAEIRRLTGR
jgi:cell pole-organizing protein PopZ